MQVREMMRIKGGALYTAAPEQPLQAAIDSMAELDVGSLVVMGLLPLLAGIHEAFSYKNADKELIKQFRFMSRLFDSCRNRLDRARDDAESRHLLRALGCACLEEHAEWILLHRERPLDASGMSG